MKKFWEKENKEMETKPIAENPQYDSEMEEEIESEENEVKGKKIFSWMTDNKKKVACIAVACVFGLTAVGYGGYQAVVSDADSSNTAKEKTVTIVDEETGEEKVVDADSEAAKEAEKNGDVVKENKSASEKATKATSSKKSASSSSSNKSSSSSNKGSSSSGGSSANKPTTHTHSWVAHYATKTTYTTETIYGTKCNGCGATGSVASSASHQRQHAINGEPGGYSTDVPIGTKQVPHTTSYIDYYYCSCGATK